MAQGLNIGTVNFGIEANTKELKKAFKDIDKLRQRVIRLARSQTDAAKKTGAALHKQELATRRTSRAFIELRKKMVASKAPKESITELERAFERLTLEMTSGKITVEQYGRAMQTFQDKMAKVNGEFSKFKAKKAASEAGQFTEALRNLESSAVLAVGPLSGIGARIRSLGAIASRSGAFMVGMFAGVTALSVGLFKLSSSALNAGRVFEASMARFKAASGSIEIAGKNMAFVVQTALKLGLRIDTSARAFSRLAASAAGTALEGEGARKVFLAVSKAAAALRLDGQEVEGTFRAIEQMMSKGSVQAEELRGQLGERLPGAFRIAAEAMGVSTSELGKMLKAGEVLAEDFLPKLADALESTFGDAAEDNINSFTGSMANLANQSLLFGKAFDDLTGITDKVVAAIQTLAGGIEFLRKNLVNMVSALTAAGAGLAFIARAQVATGIIFIANAIGKATQATVLWTIALFNNPVTGFAARLSKAAQVLAVMTAAFFGMKIALGDTGEELDELNAELDKLGEGQGINAAKNLGSAFDTLTKSIDAAIAEAKVARQVLASMGQNTAKDIELLTLEFETLATVEGLAEDQLNGLLGKLISIGSGPIADNVEGIAKAFFNVMASAVLAQEELARFASDESLIKGMNQTLEDLDNRFKAMAGGLGDLAFFDRVIQKEIDLRRAFEGSNIPLAEQTELIFNHLRALGRNFHAQEALNKAKKEQEAADKAAEQALKKFNAGIIKTTEMIDLLRARNAALAEGPDSFEVFTKVTEKVLKLEIQLKKISKNQLLINELTRQYRVELERTLQITQDNKFNASLIKAADTLELLRLRVAALDSGPGSFETFTKVTVKVLKYKEGLKEIADNQALVNELTRQYQALLEKQAQLIQRGKINETFAELIKTVKELKDRTQALRDGTIDTYESITIKVDAFRDSLEKVTKIQFLLNWATNRYKELLEEQVAVQDEISKKKFLKGVAEEIEDLNNRFAAMQSGLEHLEFFDAIIQKQVDLRRVLAERNIVGEEAEALIARIIALEIRNRDTLKALTDAQRDATEADRLAEAAKRRFATATQSAADKIAILRERLVEMAKGPDSFEAFTKVTQKVMEMRDQLEKAAGENPTAEKQKEINAKVDEYRELLEAQLKLTDRLARAHQQMAAAITNGLENILVQGGSVTDMLHDLAKELLRVALRALFLDKLQANLAAIFGGGIAPSILPSPGGGGGGGTSTVGLAHGGSFTVGGTGSKDRPVTFLGRPGEIVNVQTPGGKSQPGGGGGAAVVINQTNNFEGGGLADPAILIPLMEENNRKLKGEIVDGFRRGSFG